MIRHVVICYLKIEIIVGNIKGEQGPLFHTCHWNASIIYSKKKKFPWNA